MKMKLKMITSLIFACALITGPSWAHDHGQSEAGHPDGGHQHDAAHHDDGHHGSHGGQFIEVEGHHGIEMVVAKDKLSFYLSEDHKPMTLDGTKFKAVVQSSEGLQILPLLAKGDVLVSLLKKAIPAGAKIVISGKDGHGHTIQGRFVTK